MTRSGPYLPALSNHFRMTHVHGDDFLQLFCDDPLFAQINNIPDIEAVDRVLALESRTPHTDPRNAQVDHAFCDSILVTPKQQAPTIYPVPQLSSNRPLPRYYRLNECEASAKVSGVPNFTALPTFEIPDDLQKMLRQGPNGGKHRTKEEVEKLVAKLVHAAEYCAAKRKFEARALIKSMKPGSLNSPSAKKRCAERSRIEARVTRVSNNHRSSNLKACVRWLVYNLYS